MTEDAHYLRSNVAFEPLVDQWFAWSHLVAPATLARHVAERHLNIMGSFLRAPEVHERASKDPALKGGPFVAYPAERLTEIRSLLEKTSRNRARTLELADALAALQSLIANAPRGVSLEALYPKVPKVLRGYVELVYDACHRAGFRLIEPLLYQSEFHQPECQSGFLFTLTADERPFVMSTPRLQDDGMVHLRLPLNDPRLDVLFGMRRTAKPWVSIADTLEIAEPAQRAVFQTFFTQQAPRPAQSYESAGVRMRYYGHACVGLEAKGMSILVDPWFSYRYPTELRRFTIDDVPERVDYVLITHNHQDHLQLEWLLQLRHLKPAVVVPRSNPGQLLDPSLKLTLNALGFHDVIELGSLETHRVSHSGCTPASFTSLPFLGEHGDLDIQAKTAWHVDIGGRTLLFAADSANLEVRLYQHLRNRIGELDFLFLGMECEGAPLSWVYGPLLLEKLTHEQDQSRRLKGCGFEQARSVVDTLRPRNVCIYAMGSEPWLSHIMGVRDAQKREPIIQSDMLINYCRERGVKAERLFGMAELEL